MKKNILFVIIFFVHYTINAQNLKMNDCIILLKSMKLDIFDKQFFITKYKNEPIFMVDTSKYFQNCNLLKISARDIIILNKWSEWNEKYMTNNIKYRSHIFLRVLSFNNNILTLVFFRPYNGANLVLELRKKGKRNIKIKAKSYGAY